MAKQDETNKSASAFDDEQPAHMRQDGSERQHSSAAPSAAYLITTLYGTIQEADEVAGCMLGTARPQLAGQPLSQFVVDYARRAFRHDLRQLRYRDGAQRWFLRLQPQEREPFDACVSVAVLRDQDGEPAGLCWRLEQRSAAKGGQLAERPSETDMS